MVMEKKKPLTLYSMQTSDKHFTNTLDTITVCYHQLNTLCSEYKRELYEKIPSIRTLQKLMLL